MDEDADADSDSSKNGKRLGCSGAQTTSCLDIPEAITKRRRTSNSDDIDVENPDISSDKYLEKAETIETTEKVSVFGPLIKAAASMNPQQFELPPELVEPIVFPGKKKKAQFFLNLLCT